MTDPDLGPSSADTSSVGVPSDTEAGSQRSVLVVLAAASNPLGLLEGPAARGRIGSVDIGPEFNILSRTQVRVRFVIAVLLSLCLPLAVGVLKSWFGAAVTAVVLAVYSLFAYWVSFRPNLDHTGIAGILDNPFRLSDNINNALRTFLILFAPGRLIAHGFVDGLRLWRTGKLPQEQYLDGLDAPPSTKSQPPEP